MAVTFCKRVHRGTRKKYSSGVLYLQSLKLYHLAKKKFSVSHEERLEGMFGAERQYTPGITRNRIKQNKIKCPKAKRKTVA